jgi:phosphatidylglycerophosphatase B
MEENQEKDFTSTAEKGILRANFKNIVFAGLAGVSVVAIIAFFSNIPFSAYLESHVLSEYWLFISDTGTTWGSVISIAIAAIILGTTRQKNMKRGLLFFLSFGIVLKSFAYINESITKEIIQFPRPSFTYLERLDVLKTDSVYQFKNKTDRMDFLANHDLSNDTRLSAFNEAVLNHWIITVGYSMPSGHAQNSFLLATVLSAVLLVSLQGYWRFLFLSPVIWAILVCLSRVAMGVHTPSDVAIGALSGFLIGIIYLLSVRIRLLDNLDLY